MHTDPRSSSEEGPGPSAMAGLPASQQTGRKPGTGLRQVLYAIILVVAGLACVRLALQGMGSRPDSDQVMLALFAGGALLCLAGGLMAMIVAFYQTRRPGKPAPSGNWLIMDTILLSTLLPLLWLGLSGLAGSWIMGKLEPEIPTLSQMMAIFSEAPRRWANSGALLQTACLAVLGYFYLWRGRLLPQGIFRLRELKSWSLLGGGLAGLGLWLVAEFVQQIITRILPANWASLFPPLSINHPPVSWLAVAIYLGLAPLAEELFFRGYVYPTWHQELGPIWGMLASAALYGFYALNPLTIVPYFLVGLGLAALARVSGQLAPAWIAHLVFNLLAFLIIWPV